MAEKILHLDPRAADRRDLMVGAGCVLATLFLPDRGDAADAAQRKHARQFVELHITTNGDLLEFSTQALSCPAGSRVRLTFANAAKYVSFDHNWVLIRPGTFDAVVDAALQAGEEHEWMPQGHPAVLAATAMAHKGQTVSVEFDAPPVGKYVYLCTMPGHAASMWGVFTVTAD